MTASLLQTTGLLVGAEVSRAEAAIDLARRGFRVLPVYNTITVGRCSCPDPRLDKKPGGANCSDKGKHPRIANWQKEATSDPVQVERWWRRWPASNIGLAMGGPQRLVALDVDGDTGRASLARLEALHGPLPVTLTSRSGRVDGGEHWLFVVPMTLDLDLVKNRASKAAPGLDMRGEGGQIVVPPSIHDSGNAYVWIVEAPPAELPLWLYELAAAERRPPPASPSPSRPAAVSGSNPAYARKALEDACAALTSCPKGARNDLINAEAYALGGLCAVGALVDADVIAELLAATERGGWDASARAQTERTCRAALAAGRSKPRQVPAPLTTRRGTSMPAMSSEDLSPEALAAAGEEGVSDAAGISALDFLTSAIDALEQRPKKERSAAAMTDQVLDAALALGERSAPFARVVARLSDLAVKMHPWKMALRARKSQCSAAARASETAGAASRPTSKPRVVLRPEEAEVGDEAVLALATLPQLFQRAHALVSVVESADLVAGELAPVRRRSIRRLELPTVREMLTVAATFHAWGTDRETGESALVQVHPPDWCVRGVHARGQWPALRHLTAIVECPILRPDGSVLDAPGWDAATGILFSPSPTETFPTIPSEPTQAQVVEARDLLLDVVRDFPFELPVHRAAWLAGVLTAIGRFAFPGPAPLFAVDANAPGAGKSLLADIASIIVTGRPMARMAYSEEDELEKRITCVALDADPLVLIDNVDRPLGDPVIDMALTSTEWGGRVLGASSRPKIQLLAIWWATGNNISFKATFARRCIVIRLDTKEERPADRPGLRDIKAYVRDHRPELVAAALTLLRAWEATGRDFASFDGRLQRPIGSYEAWGQLIQGAIMHCGLPDPGEAIGALDEAMHDQDAAGLAELLVGWEEAVRVLGGTLGAVTIQAVLTKLTDNDEGRRASPGNMPPLVFPQLREALSELCSGVRPGNLPNVRQVGYALRRLKKRVSGGRRLKSWRSHDNKQVWCVEVVRTNTPAEALVPVVVPVEVDDGEAPVWADELGNYS